MASLVKSSTEIGPPVSASINVVYRMALSWVGCRVTSCFFLGPPLRTCQW